MAVREQAVGGGGGHKGQRKTRARDFAQVGGLGQGRGKPGQMARPAQGLQQVCHKQAHSQPQQQTQQGPAQGMPEACECECGIWGGCCHAGGLGAAGS